MLEIIVNLVPCGDGSKANQIAKLQIIHLDQNPKFGPNTVLAPSLSKKDFTTYEVRNCDVGEDSCRRTTVTVRQGTDLLHLIEQSIKALHSAGIDTPRRVPKSEFVKIEHAGLCVPDESLGKYHTPSEFARFSKFMTGQTSIPGYVFSDDYERWLKGHMMDSQGADWD